MFNFYETRPQVALDVDSLLTAGGDDELKATDSRAIGPPRELQVQLEFSALVAWKRVLLVLCSWVVFQRVVTLEISKIKCLVNYFHWKMSCLELIIHRSLNEMKIGTCIVYCGSNARHIKEQ